MTNVNAPQHLEHYASEHDLDLASYRETLGELQRLPFIDLEPPFAEDVLQRLRGGMSLGDAVAESREVALAHLRDT